MEGCNCLDAIGENPECPHHGAEDIVDKLRSLALNKHNDLSVALDAADLIECLYDQRKCP